MKKDLRAAQAPSTQQQYARVKKQFKEFAVQHGRRYLPASPKTVGLYVTHLHHSLKLKGSSISSQLSAIGHFHGLEGFKNPCKNTLIDSLLQSYKKTDNPPAIRKALTRNILERVLKSIQSHETGYNQTLYQTLFVFMYQGLLRCNEVAWCAKAPHNLTSEQVAMVRLKGKPHIRLRFKSYKHSKPNPPPIYLSAKIKKSSLCPVAAYRKYSKIKRGAGFFFQHRDGRPLIRRDISKTLKLHLAILGFVYTCSLTPIPNREMSNVINIF